MRGTLYKEEKQILSRNFNFWFRKVCDSVGRQKLNWFYPQLRASLEFAYSNPSQGEKDSQTTYHSLSLSRFCILLQNLTSECRFLLTNILFIFLITNLDICILWSKFIADNELFFPVLEKYMFYKKRSFDMEIFLAPHTKLAKIAKIPMERNGNSNWY